MHTCLLVGSNSNLAKSFSDKYNDDYEFLAIDQFSSTNKNLSNFFQFDISNLNDIDKFLEKVFNISIDSIIFFNGINIISNLFSVTENDWDLIFNSNLKGSLFLLKKSFSLLSKKASVLFIASQNGVVGHEDRIAYGPSKAAVIQLVKNLTVDLSKVKEKDIRVNSISPSYILTKENKDILLNTAYGQSL
ncbi:MAG: SDR family oxidoreductase, partial [Streptococcaceae bacterium]|nr:SDR family oxidoreductase [Streptococcaceae bacterium]